MFGLAGLKNCFKFTNWKAISHKDPVRCKAHCNIQTRCSIQTHYNVKTQANNTRLELHGFRNPVLGPLDSWVGVPIQNLGIDLPGWVPISLINFNQNGQETMAEKAPVALGPAAGNLAEVSDLI